MNDPPDFVVPPDHGVELAHAGQLRQLAPVFFQRLIGAFRVLGGYTLIPAHLLQSGQKFVAGEAQFLKGTVFLCDGQQHMLDAEIVVLERLLLILCAGKYLTESSGQMKLTRAASGALDLRHLCQCLFDGLPDRRKRDAGSFEQGGGHASLLVEQRQQHVLHIDPLMASPLGMGRCRL